MGEKEILDIVSKCKNKRSTDCDGIDMTIIKKVIEEIIQPLTYICNLSFQVGTFPEKMKIAKVIPLYKTEDRQHFTNYRPVSLLPQFWKNYLWVDWIHSLININYFLKVNMDLDHKDPQQWQSLN